MSLSVYRWRIYAEHVVFSRNKTDDLHAVSNLLKQEVTELHQEETNMKEYKSELDLLLAEKLHHVEILRQIHSDINMVRHAPLLNFFFVKSSEVQVNQIQI